jgi:hypothetical protein
MPGIDGRSWLLPSSLPFGRRVHSLLRQARANGTRPGKILRGLFPGFSAADRGLSSTGASVAQGKLLAELGDGNPAAQLARHADDRTQHDFHARSATTSDCLYARDTHVTSLLTHLGI